MDEHSHSHSHGHDHGHHSHAPSSDADRRWISVALALILSFMGAEIAAGLLAGSLALLSDAMHMLTDAGALALALVAARLASRPPAGRFTFGLGRAEILSAHVNGASLILLGGIVAWEGARRLVGPADVEGGIVIVVGSLGAVVNVAAAWALSRAERQSLNLAGARAHVLADLYGSLAAVASGVVVAVTGLVQADVVAALVVAALMLRSGWQLLRDSGGVLLEAAPPGSDPAAIGSAMAAVDGVAEVHDLHVWEVTSGFRALSAHVLVPPDEDCHRARRRVERLLSERFGIHHLTLQVDHIEPPRLLAIAVARA